MEKIKKVAFQFLKFGLVGVICFVIDYGLMILLTELTPISYFFSAAISFIVSLVVNYILSMRFVFKGKEGMNKFVEILTYTIISLIGLGLNQLVIWILVEKFAMFYAVAKGFATLIVSTYNFISRKVFME